MTRHIFTLVLSAFLFMLGCGEEFSTEDGGAGGTAGTAGTAGHGGNTGGSAGTGGNTGGSAGTGGIGGNTGGTGGDAGGTGGNTGGTGGGGGGGGNPCSGIYLQVASVGSGGVLGSSAGTVTSTTYDVHGTDAVNHLGATVHLVNILAGDFTVPQDTSALEAVRLRCQDPLGGPTFTVACSLPFTGGEASCVNPDCYSASGGIVQMQVQIDPVAVGTVRVGVDPNSVSICGDQSDVPTYIIQ